MNLSYTDGFTFKEMARDRHKTPMPGVLLRKSMPVLIEKGDSDRRKLFTISTEAIDRDNDKIAVDGWDLKAYMANPVVLWGHQSYSPPVGRSVEIGVEDGALKAMVEFVPGDMPVVGELAEMIYRMVDLGFLSACSVGFRPLEFERAKDREDDDSWFYPMDFTKQELLEWSICTIPANPEATIQPDEERAGTAAARKAAAEQERVTQAAHAAANVAQAEQAKAELHQQRQRLRAACF